MIISFIMDLRNKTKLFEIFHIKTISCNSNEIIKENHYKTSLRIDTLAEDYMSMARILAFGEKCAENRCYRDVVTANKLKTALEFKNIRSQRVEICGTRLPLVEIYGIPFKMPFPEKTIKTEKKNYAVLLMRRD